MHDINNTAQDFRQKQRHSLADVQNSSIGILHVTHGDQELLGPGRIVLRARHRVELSELVVHPIGYAGVDVAIYLAVVPRVPDGKAELDRVRGIVPVTRESLHRPPRALVHVLAAGTAAAAVAIAVAMTISLAVTVTIAVATLVIAVLGILMKLARDADLVDGTGEGSREAGQKGGEKDGLELHCCCFSLIWSGTRKMMEFGGWFVADNGRMGIVMMMRCCVTLLPLPCRNPWSIYTFQLSVIIFVSDNNKSLLPPQSPTFFFAIAVSGENIELLMVLVLMSDH